MPSRLAHTARSGSITPFGSAVEPLVNCRIASRSGSSAGRTQAAGSPAASSPICSIGGSSGSGVTNGASSGSTITILASAWWMRCRVWATNSSIDPSRIGSGSTTRVAPVSHVAWMADTSGRVVGDSSATWSPGPIPRACSAAA